MESQFETFKNPLKKEPSPEYSALVEARNKHNRVCAECDEAELSARGLPQKEKEEIRKQLRAR